MSTGRYNGWANYWTWNVALWIGNDEPMYRAWQRQMRREKFTAESAEKFVRDLMPNGTPDFPNAPHRYNEVDWDEIVNNWNE